MRRQPYKPEMSDWLDEKIARETKPIAAKKRCDLCTNTAGVDDSGLCVNCRKIKVDD